MDRPRAADHRLTPDAAEFVRFCYGRRAVGWPELYDEMCAVASRGLFRGWGPSELAEQGVGFGLFELPALAALVAEIVAEEQAARRTLMAARTAARMGVDREAAPDGAAAQDAAADHPGDGRGGSLVAGLVAAAGG